LKVVRKIIIRIIALLELKDGRWPPQALIPKEEEDELHEYIRRFLPGTLYA
jgi:hypothetical protein